MKRFTVIISGVLLGSLLLVLAATAACTKNEKAGIVCTIFPQYDWVRAILGERAEDIGVALLLDNKIDLHNYQPTFDDIAKISTCDLFIYVGGESDGWVEDVLKEAANKDMIAINLLEALGDMAKPEEIIEGMEEEDDDDDDTGRDHDSEPEYDEHVWLSLRNARVLCAAIADALSALDADNAELYRSNLAAYIEKLSALDAEYQSAAKAAPARTLLFGDRFPFRYLADDYGLRYYAAFAGCSAETEASFETIVFLARKVDELNLKTIMVTESSDQAIAKTIRNNTAGKNQQILALDSMQSADGVKNGATYLSVMERNLSVLKEALRNGEQPDPSEALKKDETLKK